jgi:hypothetical protein
VSTVFAKDCNTNELVKPDHFKAWDCDPKPPISGIVSPKTTCGLTCQPGYEAHGWPRPDYRWGKVGTWTKTRLECRPDIETWKKEIEARIGADEKTIDDNTAAIADNADDIVMNAEGIADNVINIDDNVDDIAINAENIAENYNQINRNRQNIRE